MSGRGPGRAWLAAILAATALCATAAPVKAAADDPLFVFAPVPPPPVLPALPPPFGNFNGPCGIGVDSAGNFYVSDYYRHTVDAYRPDANYSQTPQFGSIGYIGQLAAVDPLDGPCGLAFDAADNLYVNDYHRSVIRYGALPSFGAGTVITGAGVDSNHPTGVAVEPVTGRVYVNQRTYIGVFDSSGAVVEEGGAPLRIGLGSLEDGYGLAVSRYPETEGFLYVSDAASDTVKIYDPVSDTADPVAEIDGGATPKGEFVSLRDAAVAVDRVSGDVYVVDNLQPADSERPQAIVYVFSATNAYLGHLKFLIRDALPPGLAVDNSPSATHPAGTQGRVYVTSGNTEGAAVYAYPPGAATSAPVRLSTFSAVTGGGSSAGDGESAGGDAVPSDRGALTCGTACETGKAGGSSAQTTRAPVATGLEHRRRARRSPHRRRRHRQHRSSTRERGLR